MAGKSEGGEKREAAGGEADPKAGAGAAGETEVETGGADEGEPDDDGEPADGEADQKAAKGKEGEETPAQRRARLAKDADVQALVKSQLKAATLKAVREALAAEQAETKRKAELAAKSTEERLAAEKLEAESKATKEAERAAKAEMELAFYRHVVSSRLRLIDPDDMAFVQQAAARVMEEDSVDIGEALERVAKAKAHFFVPTDEEAAKAKTAKKAEAAKKATTTAEPKGAGTEHKADQKPKPKAVRDMTTAEFEAHRRALGIRTH